MVIRCGKGFDNADRYGKETNYYGCSAERYEIQSAISCPLCLSQFEKGKHEFYTSDAKLNFLGLYGRFIVS
jgi:hypothetical protein